MNKSIAVLPFVNMSPDPDNEYFSDGITEEIINALTKIQGLKVIARTSSFAFKGKNIDVRNIGTQLGVTTILEGSVRKAQQRLRITAQLIRTDDGSHLWSKNFDREMVDIFAVQDEISLLIADKIRENFGHFEIQDQLIEAPTQNIEAYNLYLKGRYHQLKWDPENLQKGINYYQASIQTDAHFALPYFGLGLTYGIGATWGFFPYEESIQIIEKYFSAGFSIDSESYLAHYAKATISFFLNWDFKQGQEYLLQAMTLNPSFTDAEEGLVELYTAIGSFDKAMYHTEQILSINPLSANHHYSKGNIYYLTKNYKKCIQSLESALNINPHFAIAIELLAACYIHLNDRQQLEKHFRKYPEMHPEKFQALLKLVHPVTKKQTDTEIIMSILPENNASSFFLWNLYLLVYQNRHDLALEQLEAGVKARMGQLINFQHDPFLAPLHVHDRFQKMVTTIFRPSNLPNYSLTTISKNASNKSPFTQQEVEQYLVKVSDLFEKEKIYLDPNLGLKILAEKITLHPNKLSWLLNEHIGKNFNEYVNTFRLAAFKEKALNPKNNHLTLLGLAYESGFNSKTVFNTFFKKMEGMSPRAWVKSQKHQ